MSASVGGETIHLSFGSSANNVSAHLINLYGAACGAPADNGTLCGGGGGSSDDGGGVDGAALCDPNVTHDVRGEVYVPRALFIDGRDGYGSGGARIGNGHGYGVGVGVGVDNFTGALDDTPRWDGAVQVLRRGRAWDFGSSVDGASADSSTGAAAAAAAVAATDRNAAAINDDDDDYGEDTRPRRDPSLERFRSAAVGLSHRAARRLRASRFAGGSSSRYVRSSASSNGGGGRHVVWDSSDEEDQDQDDGEYGFQDGEEVRRRREAERRRRESEEDGRMTGAFDEIWENVVAARDHSGRGRAGPGTGGGCSDGGGGVGEGSDYFERSTSGPRKPKETCTKEIPISWHDRLLLSPLPPFDSYAAPLPFDARLPPYSGAVPSESGNDLAAMIQSYHSGYAPTSSGGGDLGITRSWYEDDLLDKVRRILERCDAPRGFTVAADASHPFYCGLASRTMEDLRDECRSAVRISIAIHAGRKDGDDDDDDDDDEHAVRLKGGRFSMGGGLVSNYVGSGGGDAGLTTNSESALVNAFRKGLNGGLALHGMTSNSDLMVPLSLPLCRAAASSAKADMHACAAMALETSTLPFRLLRRPLPSSSSSSSFLKTRAVRIGVQSGYYRGSAQSRNGDMNDDDNEPFPTSDRLSLHEYASCLRPGGDRYRLLEMDAMLSPPSTSSVSALPMSLRSRLEEGTSSERRRLEAESFARARAYHRNYGGRPRDVEPGRWMEDSARGGILTRLSPELEKRIDTRGSHRHFALSASLRLPSTTESAAPIVGADAAARAVSTALATLRLTGALPSPSLSLAASPTLSVDPVSAHLRPLMESLGSVSYRPETSLGCVTRQSVASLTERGGVGSGKYWKMLLCGRGGRGWIQSVNEDCKDGFCGGENKDRMDPDCFPPSLEAIPILTLLGSSTRSHARLRNVASDLDAALSRRFGGFVTRDVQAGRAPEEEDCREVLEGLLEWRDDYEPPGGGACSSDEGEYFDGNED